jgi:hypothetical protein
MFISHHFGKAIATTASCAVAAFVMMSVAAASPASAQIPASTGGDLISDHLLEPEGIFFEAPPHAVVVRTGELAQAVTDGTSNTIAVGLTPLLHDVMVSGLAAADGQRRIRVSADVTTAGGTRRIIAILIGLFVPAAPGFTDYAEDACAIAGGGAPGPIEQAACAAMSRAFRACVQDRRLAVSARAVMAPTSDGIAIWEPR